MVVDSVRMANSRLVRLAMLASNHIAAQREALTILRRVIPFDVGVFCTVDPATVLWTNCVLDGIDPEPSREAFMFENEYRHIDLHKVSDLARNPEQVGLLSSVDPAVREQSSRYQVIRSLGAADELRCALLDGGNCWGSLELYRANDSGTFTAADAQTAAVLAESLARLVRLALLRQAASLLDAVDDPPGVIVLDREGNVEAVSPAGQRWCDDIGADDTLPAVIRSLAIRVTGDDAAAHSMMAPRASGGWLRLHAARLDSSSDQKVSIVLEPVKPAVLPETVAHVYGLTPRESEVIMLMAQGLSSKEIGGRLGISPFTVNDHAKAVFQKVGVQSRQQLIAALFFNHCLPLRERGAIPGPYGWFMDQDQARDSESDRVVRSA